MKNGKGESRKEIILGFKSRMKFRATWYDKMADFMTRSFGTTSFLIGNGIFFALWVLVNSGDLPIMPIFDPFPFNFLTMFVSLEAIFLSVIVLISQNRQGDIADIRDELDFEINVRAEQEITRILTMLDEIHDHLGLAPGDDAELSAMKENLDIKKLGDELRNENF